MPATPIEIVSVGAKVLYCVETTGGTRPTTNYTELVGISAAPGFDMTPETIDVSDITDTITQYVNGRQDPGGGSGHRQSGDDPGRGLAWLYRLSRL